MILHRWDKHAPKDPDLDATNRHYHDGTTGRDVVLAAGLFIGFLVYLFVLGVFA